MPNFRRTPRFGSCGSTVQGLSVGWADIYHRDLPGQNIDITGVPDGFYWLESEVDPENHILELDEENNIARIKVTIGNPPSPPDLFEPNDALGDFADRSPGGPNSPDLGPTNPKRVIPRWEHTDPEDNEAWVTVFLDPDGEGGTDEILLPTSLYTPADLGLAVINSAEVAPGTYRVICAITDGGSTSRAWSEGTITFIDPGEGCRVNPGSEEDCNGNFILDRCELDLGVRADCNGNGVPDDCDIAAGSSRDRDSNRIPDECEEPLFHRGVPTRMRGWTSPMPSPSSRTSSWGRLRPDARRPRA